MSAPTLILYRDAIDHLVQWLGALPSEAEQNRARGAVQQAYQLVAQDHKWRYLLKHERLNVSAPYTTGTIAYTSSTRTVTLTDGTWPTWARYGRIVFDGDDVVYKIAERDVAGSTVTLDPIFRPADDIDAGTTYTLFRSVYPLPADAMAIEEIHDEGSMWSTTYIEPSEWLALERQFRRSGKPFYWTVMGAEDLYVQMAVCFHGYPSSAQTLDFIYQRAVRAMRYDGYNLYSSQEANRVNPGGSGGFTTNFNLPEDIEGSVLRMQRADDSTTKPPGSLASMNPYGLQQVITTRTNAITGDCDGSWGTLIAALDDAHFVISDPVDLPHYLLPLFHRASEYFLAISQVPDRVRQTEALLEKARKRAWGHNATVSMPGLTIGGGGWRHPAWALLYGRFVAAT